MKTVLPEKRLRVFDFIIILLAVSSVFISYFAIFSLPDNSHSIEVTTNEKKEVFSLSKDRTVTLTSKGFTYTLEISGRKAMITEADCPDKVCAHSSPITEKGGAIVCVPGGLIIKTTYGDNADVILP